MNQFRLLDFDIFGKFLSRITLGTHAKGLPLLTYLYSSTRSNKLIGHRMYVGHKWHISSHSVISLSTSLKIYWKFISRNDTN